MPLSTSGSAAIPTEILLEIFQKLLPHRLDEEGRLAFQVLRSVCSWWRSVAFSSPVLWSSISITNSAQPDELRVQDCYFPILEAWFSRSGPTIPLELEYMDSGALLSMQSANRASLKALIQRHQPRWKFLSLCVSPDCFWDALFEPPLHDWINLHTVGLWSYDFMAVGAERASKGFDALEKMPSLRCLVVEDHDVFENTRRFGPVDLAELCFTVDSFNINPANLICGYRSLTKLTIIIPSRHTIHLSSADHLALPSLLSFTCDTHGLKLFHHLTTPALSNLEIQLRCETVPHEDEFLRGFLARCTRALRSITLNSCGDDLFIGKVLPSLSNRPTLSHLTLDMWPSSVDTDKHAEGKDYFPGLRDLTVSIGISDDDLAQMKALAAFLVYREDFGLPTLERLDVHRRFGAIAFPYEMFNDRLSPIDVAELHTNLNTFDNDQAQFTSFYCNLTTPVLVARSESTVLSFKARFTLLSLLSFSYGAHELIRLANTKW
ncbi:hypothetical protein BKA70DRAFT_1464608, partial [Coprinopsis sp. MPI-PUGE-AT-0042]